MRDSLIEKTYRWSLVASPAALWPILSDTARLNEALKMPRYRISETFDRDSMRRRYGEMVEDGSQVRWEEPSFEWVEGGWWRWRRFYDEGPLRETGGMLMLMPSKEGGTRVSYTLTAEPNGFMGRALVASGHLKLAARAFEKFTNHIDAHCRKPHGDFYSNFSAKTAKKASPKLPKPENAEAELLTQFAEWLAIAPLADRLDLRSRRLAKCLGVTDAEALRACLLAVKSGDLTMRYRAICPTCRASAIEVATLGKIPALLACRRCGAGYHRDLDGTVEVLFSVPGIHPDEGVYCGSGPALMPHAPVQQNVGALERRDLAFQLPRGVFCARAQDGAVSEIVELTSPTGIHVQVTDAGITIDTGSEGCVVENHCKRDFTVSIERCDWSDDALPVSDLLAEQAFHDLMPEQILPDGDSASVGFGVILGIGDLPTTLTHDRAGALIDQEEGYHGLVFTSLKRAMATAESLKKKYPDARIALDCGPLTIGTLGGKLRYIGTVPETARSLSLAGYRNAIQLSPRLKEALSDAGLPVPKVDATTSA